MTPEGNVVGGLLVFFGIGLIGAASSKLTTLVLKEDDDPIDNIENVKSDVREVALELEVIKGMICCVEQAVASPSRAPAHHDTVLYHSGNAPRPANPSQARLQAAFITALFVALIASALYRLFRCLKRAQL